MEVRETVAMTFRTSLDKRHTMRFNQPRVNIARNNLNLPIQLLTNGTQYFDDDIGTLTDFIEAKHITVTTETLF
ncbi:MAG: hypothetical protein FWF77_05535 [Defluviitaleaceae bacterium]|nr:hypothetical protein [Defluviitaleaceae bacterium]